MNINMLDPIEGMIEFFQKKKATTPEKALTLRELGIPDELKKLIPPVMPEIFPFVKVGEKYYLSEERLANFREQGGFVSPIKKWIQHTAKVPKGFLRYSVLHKLKGGPMSGAELTSAITEDMRGRWKPKPGSMYPLLKSLLEEGFTQEVPSEDERTRRYELTERGHEFLKDQVDQSGELRQKIDQGLTPFSPPFFPIGSHMEIPESLRNLFETLLDLRVILGSNISPEILNDLVRAADRFTKDLEKIQKKIASSDSVD
jgi:DNA-binding PadR family transcriptional regulator